MIQDFLSLFFPNYCFTCRETLVKGEAYLCTTCRYSLPKTNYHLADQNPLFKRFGGLMPLSNIFAYLKFSKKGMVQVIMEKLKYQNCPEIGVVLGQWYGAELRPFLSGQIDIVLPVPLHTSKKRKRGYNQSDFFAKGLSLALDVPWNPKVLKRKVKSETQTKKGRKERFDNDGGDPLCLFVVFDRRWRQGCIAVCTGCGTIKRGYFYKQPLL